jgi:RNA polymerase sigma-70 factor (ECF subfamily)
MFYGRRDAIHLIEKEGVYGRLVEDSNRLKIMAWVGSEVIPHEPAVRGWLRRMVDATEVEDVVQEAYCRIASLTDVSHIRSGRAYLFTTVRMLVIERIRRSRVVKFETITEIETSSIVYDEPSPERVAAGRRELDRVTKLIEALPERCRRVFEMRKVEGLSQREVATALNLPEYTIENDVAKGLKLILHAIGEGDEQAERILMNVGTHGRARDSTGDQ